MKPLNSDEGRQTRVGGSTVVSGNNTIIKLILYRVYLGVKAFFASSGLITKLVLEVD